MKVLSRCKIISAESLPKEILQQIRYGAKGEFKINSDNSVNVNGDVSISDFDVWPSTQIIGKDGKLKVKYNKVSGDMTVQASGLKSMENFPEEIGGRFSCQETSITSLDGFPKKVGGGIYIGYSLQLVTLKGAPKRTNDTFDCFGCKKLTSLKFAPEYVGRDFDCHGCGITSLEGCPKEVKGDFICYNCKAQFTEEEVREVCKVGGKVIVERI